MSHSTTSAAASQKKPQGGPSTPGATNIPTPRSHPTPSTGLPTQTNSPSAIRTAASPAQKGGLHGLAHANLAGKSPAQQGTPGRHVAAKSILGAGTSTASPNAARSTPASQNGMATGMVHAPSTGSNALNISGNFESPSGLGGLHLAGNMGMNISLSSMGFSLSNAGASQLDEHERMRRLETVIALLGRGHGRLSRENLVRLGRRYGFDEVISDYFLKNEDKTLYFAGGNHVVVEIECEDKQSAAVKKVAVTFSNLNDAVTEHQEAAGKVFRANLVRPDRPTCLTINLDEFADNLERLSRLHQLSVPGANCFEALAGLYNSLKRLFEHEKKEMEQLDEAKDTASPWRAAREVMCKRCGKPRMHARKRFGLSLDYWMHRRKIGPSRGTSSSNADNEDQDMNDPQRISSLVLECDYTAPSLMYSRIRVTDDWISQRITGPPDQGDNALGISPDIKHDNEIEWLDPEAPLVPAVDPQNGNTGAPATRGQPKAHFVAKIEPRVAIPIAIAVEMHAAVGINADITEAFDITQAIFGDKAPGHVISSPIRVTRQLNTFDSSDEYDTEEYQLSLFCSKQDAFVKLAQMPFQHPREVISFLPVLRQWAFTARLLQNTFNDKGSLASDNVHEQNEHVPNGIASSNKLSKIESPEAELDALLDGALRNTRGMADVELRVVSGMPQFTVTIPGQSWPRSISFAVQPNADIALGEQNIVLDADGDGGQQKLHALTQALTICEDIGIWAKWIQQRYPQ